jgi:sulfotransferase
VDSVERLVQRNRLLTSKMFGPEPGNVYARAEVLMKGGFLGSSLHAFQQAWYGEDASRLIVVQYDSLAARPAEVMRKLYQFLDMRPFDHDFNAVEYDEPDFDSRLNMPGLHRVGRRVEKQERRTILPPDLFQQFDGCFWTASGQNPRKVALL